MLSIIIMSFINLDGHTSEPFELYENLNISNGNNGNKFNNLTGKFTKNNLTNAYFSDANIDYLQNEMISRIYKLTNGIKIPKQSEDELLIIMRSIYLQYGKNNSKNIPEQVEELNKKILNYSVDNIFSNIKQRQKYIKDITSQRSVLDKPEYVHIKGEKTLKPNHFF